MEQIMVSICCITYNHEKYIKDTLEGFLMQKTNFKIEILVHDDASTDKTQEIIKEYERRFPNIISSILQNENQYSKNVYITELLLKKAKGKYIAFCEGDDYWVDENKLRKQVEYFESHPNCSFCFTNAYVLDEMTGEKRVFVPINQNDEKYYEHKDKDYTLDNFYELTFAPTATFMFPAVNLSKRPQSFFEPIIAGDLRMRLYYTGMGYAHYIDEKTSVYRINVPNSVTTNWKKSNKESAIKRNQQILHLIDNVNEYTNCRYSEGLNILKDYYYKIIVMNFSNYKFRKDKILMNTYCHFTTKEKILLFFRIIIPEDVYVVLRMKLKKLMHRKL